MHNKKYLIIGLGLIGGSLARALKEKLGADDISAIDNNGKNLEQALADGVIKHAYLDDDTSINWNADIIFICTPVSSCIKYIEKISGHVGKECIVTDVCSTKSDIIHKINALVNAPCFVGGHPMAGSEHAGYSSGYAHMFENAYYILTPSKTTTSQALDFISRIVKGIGAIPVILDADEHDRITGSISHIPHIIASALVNMVHDMDSHGKMQLLAAGGFKDITRIASSNPEIWKSIVCSNKQHIMELLDSFIKLISKFNKYVLEKNENEIFGFFNSAKLYRDSMPTSQKALVAPIYDLVVDVVDEPGIIGRIATILGNNGINIKNINVSNSREYEQGCLRITFADQESVQISSDLLSKQGYKIYK